MTDQDVKEFLVPDLGEGLEDATITGWNVAVGAPAESGRLLGAAATATGCVTPRGRTGIKSRRSC